MENHIKNIEGILKITFSELQKEQFHNYYLFLIAYNKKTNLTRITEQIEVYYKHFLDSLYIINLLDFNSINFLCDIGSGAGFPAIPLKIIFPHLKITIIDSLNKRIVFLKELIDLLDLKNITLVNKRAEEYALSNLNKFDLVVARAFAKCRIFLEIALPMTKVNHFVIALKGKDYQAELDEAKGILKAFASEIVVIDHQEIPFSYGTRNNILIKKHKDMRGFPRDYQLMLKRTI